MGHEGSGYRPNRWRVSIGECVRRAGGTEWAGFLKRLGETRVAQAQGDRAYSDGHALLFGRLFKAALAIGLRGGRGGIFHLRGRFTPA